MAGGPQDNGYAHPIEGVVTVVDLIGERILTLVDDPVAIPVPRTKCNYDPASLPPMRTDLKPLLIVQPEGPSFTVKGWDVTWQNWRCRVGFTLSVGQPGDGFAAGHRRQGGRVVLRARTFLLP